MTNWVQQEIQKTMSFKSNRTPSAPAVEHGRLCLFLPSLFGGGAERVMVNLANGFVKKGLAVDLVLAKAEGPYREQVLPEVRLVDLGASRVIACLPQLVRYLRQERPSVLLSALDHANVLALWAKRLAFVDTRIVVSVHSTASLSKKNARLIRERLLLNILPWFYPLADGIIVVSQGAAQDLAEVAGLPRSRIEVIYNPVITENIRDLVDASLDHPWFAPGEPPVILAVGRLTVQKDFRNLVAAFARVRSAVQARLLILGEGEERPALEALIAQLGLGQDVAMPGFVGNPYAYMARASLFVLSSRWEGFGNVLVEAMYCGCPVVSTDCPNGPREILDNGKYGLLVPPGDEDALAKAMIQALNHPIRSETLKTRAEDFTVDTICDRYLRFLI